MIFNKIKLLIEKFKDLDEGPFKGVCVISMLILSTLFGLGGLLYFFTDIRAFALLGLPFAIIMSFILLGLWALVIFFLFFRVINIYKELSEYNYEAVDIILLLIKLVGSFFLCGGLAWYFFEFITEVFPVAIKAMIDITNFF